MRGGETIDNMNQLKMIEKIWRTGFISVVVLTMVFGGLFLNLKVASANNPNMTIRHLGVNSSNHGESWSHGITVNPGNEVDFYAEIHNTVVDSQAQAVTLKDMVTGGNFTDGSSVATVSATNANSASDTVNIHINGGGKFEFIPDSANVTWDVNGDGNYEFKDTYVVGNPMSDAGLRLGQQGGCNNYIIQVSWAARVVGSPTPTPTPSPKPTPSPTPSPKPSPSPSPSVSPTPSPTPTPTPVVSPSPTPVVTVNNNENKNEQHQEQNNHQTVNITTSGQVAGATTVPLKTPDTGVSVLGMASMFGAGPVGFALSRFGRAVKVTGKREEEENLSEVAVGLSKKRSNSSA